MKRGRRRWPRGRGSNLYSNGTAFGVGEKVGMIAIVFWKCNSGIFTA